MEFVAVSLQLYVRGVLEREVSVGSLSRPWRLEGVG